jgi:hypothetical protein
MNAEKCDLFDSSLSRWLDDSWDSSRPVVPAELSEHADACPRCHRKLVLALRLLGADHEPPEHLADDVMERIERADAPRKRLWVVQLAAAAMLVIALGTGLVIGASGNRTVTVELTLHAPQAGAVAVVGDWNGWDPMRDPLMDPDGDGVWQIELRLKSGTEHMYQFVIDQNTRTPDPLALVNVNDGYGGVNSVLNL